MVHTPTPQDIRDLRKRHGLTQKKLAESLYHIKEITVRSWEREGNNRRGCPDIIWWAMVLTWDKVDLWAEENK